MWVFLCILTGQENVQQRSTAPFGSGADTEPPLWTILWQVTLGKNKHLAYFHENIHFYSFLSFSLSFTLLKISNPCLQQFCILVSSFDPCSTAPFWHVVKMLHPLFQGQLHNWFIMHPVSCTILYAAPHACNSQSTFFNLFFLFFFCVAEHEAKIFTRLYGKSRIFVSLKLMILKPSGVVPTWHLFTQCFLLCT